MFNMVSTTLARFERCISGMVAWGKASNSYANRTEHWCVILFRIVGQVNDLGRLPIPNKSMRYWRKNLFARNSVAKLCYENKGYGTQCYCLGLIIVSITIRNNIMARVELCVNLCSRYLTSSTRKIRQTDM